MGVVGESSRQVSVMREWFFHPMAPHCVCELISRTFERGEWYVHGRKVSDGNNLWTRHQSVTYCNSRGAPINDVREPSPFDVSGAPPQEPEPPEDFYTSDGSGPPLRGRAYAYVVAPALLNRRKMVESVKVKAGQGALFDEIPGLPPPKFPTHPPAILLGKVREGMPYLPAPKEHYCVKCGYNFWWVPSEKPATRWKCGACAAPPPSQKYDSLTVVA